jgi:2-oxoisovalerate dehydrogenase E2 component (dihydrolipoyl transacylase)
MMGTYIIKTPDIGEGIAEVELVAWHVKEGDTVAADQVLADVMTDKATVEIPSPVAGRVLTLGGSIGQAVAVGSELIRLEVEGEGNLKAGAAPAAGTAGPAAHPAGQTGSRCPPPRFFRPLRCHRRSMPASACGRPSRRRLRRKARKATPPSARSLHPPCVAAPGNWASRWSRCVPPVRPGASCRRTWTLMPAPTLAWRHPRPHARRPVRP